MRTMLIALALIATTAQAQAYFPSERFDANEYFEQKRQERRLQEIERRQREIERRQREVGREIKCRGADYEAICRAYY